MLKPFCAGLALLALAAVPGGVEAAPASTFTLSSFDLKTAQDLLDVCTTDPKSPHHVAARAFCYGFVSGGQHYHDEISTVEGLEPIACPGGTVTRDEVVAVFVQFMQGHPEAAARRPMDTLVEAVAAKWPCPAAH